jgi:hypothetical protein
VLFRSPRGNRAAQRQEEDFNAEIAENAEKTRQEKQKKKQKQ